jgi:hypothetical protein
MRPEAFGQERKPQMFATFKRVAKLIHTPSVIEREMAYLNEAGYRFDFEDGERNRARGVLNRNYGF